MRFEGTERCWVRGGKDIDGSDFRSSSSAKIAQL